MNSFLQKNRDVSIKKMAVQSGFTLIELIVVMVILSILATIGTGFVVKTTESYQRTQTRALLVNTSRQALERMTRQLRIALPYSVRITNGGNCLEFMPIAAGGNYFDPVPDEENLAAARQTINASPVTVNFGSAEYVTIGAMGPQEIYDTGDSLATYVSGAITLAAAKQWKRNSINKRYYLLDNPQAFCVVGNQLHFYEDIPIADANVSVGVGASIIARGVAVENPANPKPFTLEIGSENRNTRINIALIFSSGGESITFNQGVLIRNVP